MCLKRKLFILSIFVVLFPLPINAVSWEVYFKDNNGFEYFIDKDSVHKTPKGTFLVRHQLIFSKTGEIKWGLHKSHFKKKAIGVFLSQRRLMPLSTEKYVSQKRNNLGFREIHTQFSARVLSATPLRVLLNCQRAI
jgi:hypothetical protein